MAKVVMSQAEYAVEASKRTCLLVLGMHRSGTSALTRVLSLAGARLPQRMLDANDSNKAGHWEPEALINYHDQLLAELGSFWHDWRPLDVAALSQARRHAVQQNIIDIIRHDYAEASLIVLKEPRICRFVPFFSEALSLAGFDIVPVLPVRNPLEVIGSLEARNSMARTDAALLWLRHVLDAEAVTRDTPRALSSYDGLLADWRSQLEAISNRTGLTFPNAADDIDADVDMFLDGGLRHHARRAEDVSLDPVLRGWVSDTYEALTALVGSPGDEHAQMQLDEIRSSFERATPVLSTLVDTHRRQVDQLEAALAKSAEEAKEAEAARLEAAEAAEAARLEAAEAARLEAAEAAEAARLEAAEAAEAARLEADKQVDQLSTLLKLRERELGDARAQKAALDSAYRGSTSWKITAPLRGLQRLNQRTRRVVRILPIAFRVGGGIWPTTRKAISVLKQEGAPGVIRRLSFVSRDLDALQEDKQREISRRPPSLTILPEDRHFRSPNRKRSLPDQVKKVLLVGHNAGGPLFGAELSLIDLAAAIDRAQYAVIIVLPRDDPTYINKLAPYSDKIIVERYGWRNRSQAARDEINAFKKLIYDNEIDLVHINTSALEAPLIAARETNVRSIVHLREILPLDPDLALVFGQSPQAVLNSIVDQADMIVGNSEATVKYNGLPDSTPVVYNQVMDELFEVSNDVDPSSVKIGIISSNISKKGVREFALIAEKMVVEAPNLTFVVVGPENRFTAELQREFRNLKNLQFAGYKADPVQAISCCNVVLSLSLFMETFGRTVAEAMAAGRPVISYEWGAVPELITHGETGFLIPYRRYEDAIPILQRLANHPDMIGKIGSRARAVARTKFSSLQLKSGLAPLYRRVLNGSDPTNIAGVPRRVPPVSNQKIKIAYFLWHFPVPSETFVLNELRHLVGTGYEVEVFCRQSPYPDFVPDFPITYRRVVTPQDFAEALQSGGFTVAHAHFTYPTVTEFLWPACELSNIPFTFIAHSQDIFKYANDKVNRIGEIARSPFCKRVFVPGRFHYTYLIDRGVPEGKISINAQGIYMPFYENQPVSKLDHSDGRRVCCVQRFVAKKGLGDLIRAGKELERDGVVVNIFGYGPLEEEMASLIAELQAGNVQLKGPVGSREELLEIFDDHDLFVSPCTRAADGDMDGIPTVLMEAMARGLPVVSTTISSIGDLIKDGVTGLECAPDDPQSIASTIRHFYSIPKGRVEALAERARDHVRAHYSTDQLQNNLLRVWADDHVDIIIVSWNNLPELKEVIGRILRFTTTPYRLTIVDNASSESGVQQFLLDLDAQHEHISVLIQKQNNFVGPGTNIALANTSGRFAIYVCGKEGFPLQSGWEDAMLSFMENNPEVGIGGTLTYSPTYLHGQDYLDKLEAFSKFRNRSFVDSNRDRLFRHVQGGLFILRREMFEEIGGFSQSLPHNYTDVEYSYYAESCGWRLGNIPEVKSIYNKTRPGLVARIDENVVAMHPGDTEVALVADAVAQGSANLCNVCGWSGRVFYGQKHNETCPKCRSIPADRSLFRFLTESTLMFRRLKAVAFGLGDVMEPTWQKQFQGKVYPSEVASRSASSPGADLRLDFRDGSLDLAYFRGAAHEDGGRVLAEFARVLGSGGLLIIQERFPEVSESVREKVRARASQAGFEFVEDHLYSSSAVRFGDERILTFRRK